MGKKYLIASIALLSFMSWLLFQGSEVSVSQMSASIQSNLDEELRGQDELSLGISAEAEGRVWSVPDQYLFVFRENQLVAWSTNSFAPDISWSGNPGDHKFVKTLRGDFLTTTHLIDDGRVVISVIPLVERFRITNKYLSPVWNKEIFGDTHPALVATPADGYSPISIRGST